MIEGIAAGLFGLTAALYLGVFKKNRLRVITGIILAVYAAYLVKDIVYLIPYVAADEYIYRVLLSVDNWAVPLYVVYAFEVISPGRITIPKVLLLFLPFVGMTVLYAAWPYDWMFSLQVVFASVFSAVCMCVVLRMTIKYRRRLLDNCSDITYMDIRWMWVSIALFLPNLVLWIFLSARLDYILDAVYYITLSVSWGIVAYHTYYFVPQTGQDIWADLLPSSAVSWNFARKLSELASNGYLSWEPTGPRSPIISTRRWALHSTTTSTLTGSQRLRGCSPSLPGTGRSSSWPRCPVSTRSPLSGVPSPRSTVCLRSSTARGCSEGGDVRIDAYFTYWHFFVFRVFNQ